MVGVAAEQTVLAATHKKRELKRKFFVDTSEVALWLSGI
jgi:hypothetical protein